MFSFAVPTIQNKKLFLEGFHSKKQLTQKLRNTRPQKWKVRPVHHRGTHSVTCFFWTSTHWGLLQIVAFILPNGE